MMLLVKGKSGYGIVILHTRYLSIERTLGIYVGNNRYKLNYLSRATEWTCLTFDPSKVEIGLYLPYCMDLRYGYVYVK